MSYSIKEKCIIRLISIIVLITFLWSNIIWAGGVDYYKLSAPSQITALVPIADVFAAGQEVVRDLTKNGITTKDAFYRGLEEKLRDGKIEEFCGVPCLVFSDQTDPSKLAYYVFNPSENYFSRITTHPEANDSLWNYLNLIGIGECALPDVREFREKGATYYQRVFAITDKEKDFIDISLKHAYPDWQIKLGDKENSFDRVRERPVSSHDEDLIERYYTLDAKLNKDIRGINITFNSMDKYPVSTTPTWHMAGWEMRFVQLAPEAILRLDPSSGKNYVKVITGRLSNIARGSFAPVKSSRSTLVEENYIQAGDEGAIVTIMNKTDKAPQVISRMDEANVTGPLAEFLAKEPLGYWR